LRDGRCGDGEGQRGGERLRDSQFEIHGIQLLLSSARGEDVSECGGVAVRVKQTQSV
jgi:hypothetical protein